MRTPHEDLENWIADCLADHSGGNRSRVGGDVALQVHPFQLDDAPAALNDGMGTPEKQPWGKK